MKEKIVKRIEALVIALGMILAFNYNPGEKFNFNIVLVGSWLVIFILLSIILKKRSRFKFWPFINSLAFAVFIIIGKIYDYAGSILEINSIGEIFKILIYISCLTLGFYLILRELYQILIDYKPKVSKLKNKKWFKFIFEDHPFLIGALIPLLVSVFYLLFFYPGTFSFDGKWQLNAMFGIWERNDHHPALLSLFMMHLFKLGRTILNDNLGVFLYILIQIGVNALVYAYTVKLMKSIDTPPIFRVVTLIFYAAFPLLAINSITYIKDTIYYLIFLLIVVYQFYHLEIKRDMNGKKYILLASLYIILYIWRNTGFYIGVIGLVFLIFSNFKNKKVVFPLLGIIGSILLFNTIYHKVLLPKLNIEPALPREKMSIFLQQTARYVSYYPQDITRQEKDNLEKLFKVDIYNLAEVYDPNRSDNVKERIHNYPTDEEFEAYFKAWFSMFKKHPLIYVDATLNNTYGYFYSKNRNFMGEEIGFYNISEAEDYDVHFMSWSEVPRELLTNLGRVMCDSKITGLLYSPFLYTWILIILTGYHLMKKNFKFLSYFIPLYLTFALCLISPVNGHMRYMQPIMVSLPMMIAFTIYNNTKNSKV